MAKKPVNPLQAALSVVPDSKPEPTPKKPAKEKATAKRVRPDREATVMIGGHFPKSVKQQLRMIAAEEDTTSQALLTEALNLLFIKKGKEQIL